MVCVFVEKLVCSRCGEVYDPSTNPIMCGRNDLGRLDVYYDYDAVAESFTAADLERRPPNGVWRFAELLPADPSHASRLSEGNTPLIKASRLGDQLGLTNLFIKDETRNPTASFKDRAMAVGASKAREMGRRDVVIASSGNAASALAAYSASLNLRCVAFVPEDVAIGKVSQLLLYGAKVLRVKQVEEGRDPTVDLMLKAVKELGWYPCPSFGPFNPYQVEGPKTIVYELVMQMKWRTPDFILVPTGSGCLAAGVWKALKDLKTLGLIDAYPKLVPVQPEGNMPLVKAIKEGKKFEEIEPTKWPKSIASGLLDPFPWDGDAVLEGVLATGGYGVAVGEDEIRDAVKLLAKHEGVFSEPSGAVGIAALNQLLSQGVVERSDEVVVLVTASGLKEPEKVATQESLPLVNPVLRDLLRYL